jgi:hypothetical protein
MEDGQTMQWTKGQTIIYKNYTKLKIEKHELYWKLAVNLVAPEAEILVTLARWVQYAYFQIYKKKMSMARIRKDTLYNLIKIRC